MKAVIIEPKSPIRIGGLKGFESHDEIIHSDTIFGAVVNAIAYMNLDIQDFISRVDRGEVRISSALPMNKEVYFPAPMVKPKVEGDEKALFKKYRKGYIDKETFERVLFGKEIASSSIRGLSDFFITSEVASVAIDRERNNTNLYTFITIKPLKFSTICILVDSSDLAFNNFIKPAFKLLADEGLGGNRNTGFGHFDYRFEDFNLNTPNSEYYVTLSLSIAEKKNLISYELVKRGGYVFSRSGYNALKPLFFMLKEGSIIKKDSGKLLDLDEYGNYSQTVGHKIYVYAKVFPVPISEEYFVRD